MVSPNTSPETSGFETIDLAVEGMRCAGCVSKVTQTLEQAPGITQASVNLAAESARITFDPNQTTAPDIADAVDRAGFHAAPGIFYLSIEGMHCATCVSRIEQALAAVPSVQWARANLATASLRLGAFDGPALRERVISALEDAGYLAQWNDVEPTKGESDNNYTALRPFLEVGFSLAIAVVFLTDMIWMMAGTGFLSPTVQIILALPVQLLAFKSFGWPAWASMRHGVANMDLLVVLGTGAAFFLSTAVWLGWADGHLYFEAAVMVTSFVLLGRLLEGRAKQATGQAIRGLSKLRPATAIRLFTDESRPQEETVAVERLTPGDKVVVMPGMAFPADGTILEGRSTADEALLTGESLPVPKSPGDTMVCGAVNGDGRLVAEVERTGGRTLLAQVTERVLAAQSTPAPLQRHLDRIAAVFVPAVIVIAIATFAGWWASGASVEAAIITAVSVLVIACPCALGLAIPVSVVVAMGKAARLGLLIKDPGHLDVLGRVKSVAWDKTGTLTEGRLELSYIQPAEGLAEEDFLALAAALQLGSSHPLAEPVRRHAMDRGLTTPEVTNSTAQPGQGVEADVDGIPHRMGRASFVQTDEQGSPAHDDFAGTLVWLARKEGARWQPLGVLGFQDQPRAGSADAVATLAGMGITSQLLTGDRQAAADAVAQAIGITQVSAENTPESKSDAIRAQGLDAGPVMFVGDGVNDAPALAEADVGAALSTGTDVALDAGDVTLLRPEPDLVPAAIHLARRTNAVIRQNLFWAFGYNALAIPLAASGLLTPMVAGAAMALSSISVVLNALRLRA